MPPPDRSRRARGPAGGRDSQARRAGDTGGRPQPPRARGERRTGWDGRQEQRPERRGAQGGRTRREDDSPPEWHQGGRSERRTDGRAERGPDRRERAASDGRGDRRSDGQPAKRTYQNGLPPRPRRSSADAGPLRRGADAGDRRSGRDDDRRPRADDRRPRTDDRRSSIDDRRSSSDNRRPRTDDRRSSSDERRPRTDERRPRTDDRRSSSDERRPRADGRASRSDSRSDRSDGPRTGGWRGDRPAPGKSPAAKWGGVARRGARSLSFPEGEGTGPSASEVWREAVARANAEQRDKWEPDEVWIQEPAEDSPPPGSSPAGRAPSRRGTSQPRDIATGREGIPTPGGRRRKVPRPVLDELTSQAGPARGAKLASRISDASYAYQKERYQDARRILKVLADEAPRSAAVRELYGLVLYRTGQWTAAVRQLEAFRELSGSFDQHPVLADCYRALKRYDDAEAVWEDLRVASPNAELVAEGRIVAAGCRADQGDLTGALALLERAVRRVPRPQERHLRQWYVLADLYEQAGDVPRARELFERVSTADPDAFDVRARLRALR